MRPDLGKDVELFGIDLGEFGPTQPVDQVAYGARSRFSGVRPSREGQHPRRESRPVTLVDRQAVYRRLDTVLTQEMLRSITDSHHEKRVAYTALYDEEEFGQKGWQRVYPQPFQSQ